MSTKYHDNEIVSLDVRPILSGGTDPFMTIMNTVQTLSVNQTLKIINTFQPLPLITKMQQMGYEHWVEQPEAGIFYTFFKKSEVGSVAANAQLLNEHSKFDALYKNYVGKLKSIDVRHLEMPEPMTTILSELEHLPINSALFVDHKKVPQFLLPELVERGFEIHYKKVDTAHVQLLIFKK